ncbi:geranyl transferase [Halalkalibacillus sediminis]|uniref:Farnesyl diphosphate synthase n=1 Tax=Halalkalibacillus sediminis TaxID=2018042 RepID=A0A2I0QYI7_9BACI|nr:geranyl transferase [Halalkalibacillus sediminis]
MQEKQHVIHSHVQNTIHHSASPNGLQEALSYAVSAGGKRLRPILMLSTFEAFSDDIKKALTPAVALELIHTYSLIHDDLPAMDNDDMRRGKPTIHKKFDESTAILVGDGLLTLAFQLITESSELGAEEKIYIIHQLSKASGINGMIAGQFLDLRAEGEPLSEEKLNYIHQKKTGELIRAAIKIGSYLGGATPPQIEALNDYGHYLGLVFQIQDDILDIQGDETELGKPIGSDVDQNKTTYPSLLGMDQAIHLRNHYMALAEEKYEKAGINQDILKDFINLFGKRTY